jgi:hypothetical protein
MLALEALQLALEQALRALVRHGHAANLRQRTRSIALCA